MNNLNWKYYLLLALIAANVFLIYGVLSIFTIDRYTLFISIFVNVPFGTVSLSVFLFAWLKEKNKTTTYTFVLIVGILIGIITALLSPTLFYLT